MSKLTFVTCLCLCVCFVKGQWAIDDDGCNTPFRGYGSCVGIYSCQPLVTFLRNAPRPLSRENADLIRSYQCGFEQTNIKVCCPSDPGEIARLVGSSSGGGGDGDPEAPDVSSHRNLRLLPEDCGRLSTDERIINGNQTGLFEFPWMALLSYRLTNGPEFRCGGSIINNRYILTAAHCITELKYPILGVRVGEHDLRTKRDCETVKNRTTCAPPVQDVAIERLIVHPGYNRTSFTNDIGLIRLGSRLNFVANIAPVCLPVTAELAAYNFSSRQVIVTGFGATETGRNSPTLLKVQIPYIERSECRRVYQNAAPITHKQLCAGGRNRQDSCGGDSGGPLQIAAAYLGEPKYVQQGITSFGPRNCGAEGNPGVYTRIAYFMDWILDNISR
ncbi:serine protease grass-like [Coccinella septempunctata]|uniref:serine protease grass-like n=1 Tax=Coccinella septempunctata TaxID=41139 RepID=UPI001D071107|nr:serine protease grass-like [Coccinella septempunctata]